MISALPIRGLGPARLALGLGAEGTELGPETGRVPALTLEHLNLDQDANSLFAETQDFRIEIRLRKPLALAGLGRSGPNGSGEHGLLPDKPIYIKRVIAAQLARVDTTLDLGRD